MFQLNKYFKAKDERTQRLFDMAKVGIALLIILGFAVYQITDLGMTKRTVFLLATTLISVLAAMLYYAPKRTVSRRVLSYVPYIFGIYLFFLEGFIRLFDFVTHRDFLDIFISLFFFIAGNTLARIGYNGVAYKRGKSKQADSNSENT